MNDATRKALAARLNAWLEQHKEQVADSRLLMGALPGHAIFLAIRKNDTYNRTLEDDLSDLDIAIANDEQLKDISLSVFSLPESDVPLWAIERTLTT